MNRLSVIGLFVSIVGMAPAASAAQLIFGFDAFIPTARVDNPLAEVLPPFYTEFIGDDRDFDRDATLNGEARLFTQVVVDTDAPDLIVSTFTAAGTTLGFFVEDGVEVTQSAQATPTSRVEARRMDPNTIRLAVAASATNPLIENFLPPDAEAFPAEYRYDITVTLRDDSIHYSLIGTTREYPSYSVYLNQAPLLLNPADGEDARLLGNLEPVSATGVVPIPEPAMLLALGMVSASLCVGGRRLGS